METVRFAIYSRKSVLTDRGESVENQVELCRRCLAAQYPDVGPEEIAVYEDEGFSGKDLQRPQFRRMLEDIRRERPEALVCYRLDRVSRSVGDFADLIRKLEGWGVGFLCIREKFDTSTPMGKAMMYIASVFAQLERETIAQRVRDNMRLLARTGRWLGGVPPTGFRAERAAEVIVDGRLRTACRLVPEPAEWRAAGEIFRLFLARQGLTGLPFGVGDQISQIVLLLQGNTALAGAMQLYLDTVSQGIGTLRQGTSAVREGYAAFDSGIQAMAGVLNGMLQNMALLSDAVSTLAAQYGVFDTGVNAYTQGVDQILAGTQQLSAASLMLVAGAHQLYTETSSMQLDEELGSLLDTLSAPSAPASFTSGQNTVSALQFALQTEPIQPDAAADAQQAPAKELTFWEKLLDLFGLYDGN